MRAFAAYHSAGQHTDVARVQSVVNILDFAKWAQDNHLYRRACDLLLDNGLSKQAGEMLSSVSGRGLGVLYTKARLLANSGNFDKSQEHLDELARFGYKGSFLAALVIADVAPENAKRIADGLSGVKVEVPEVSPDEDQKKQKLLISGTDPSEMARGISSMIFFATSSESEGLYYALRIYKKLEMNDECERCLSLLKEKGVDDKYFLYGVITMRGADDLNESGHHFSAFTRLTAAIVSGMSDQVIQGLEGGYYEDRHEERYKLFLELLCEVEDVLPELVDFESTRKLQSAMINAKAEVTKLEEAKLREIEAFLEKGDLPSLQVAHSRTSDVKFSYTETDYTESLIRVADSANADMSPEAQKFAGEIYSGRGKYASAVSCARRLLEAGEIDDAKSLFSKVGNGLSYRSKREEVNQLAEDLEERWPRISLELYKTSLNQEGIERTAKRLLETGQRKEVEEAARAISIIDKKSLMMRDALLQLEAFGDDGKKLAADICIEMRIPKLFVAK